jgi:hypothetical protein
VGKVISPNGWPSLAGIPTTTVRRVIALPNAMAIDSLCAFAHRSLEDYGGLGMLPTTSAKHALRMESALVSVKFDGL